VKILVQALPGRREIRGWIFLSAVILAGCATIPPDNVENICDIFRERPSWYETAKNTSARWRVPIPVMMAIIHQESRFDGTAYPPRTTVLGFIPGPRPSTAYGYAQALSETWEIYVRETGNEGADRDDFEDAIDFVGWFCHRSYLRCRIPKTDAFRLYLAHHEGQDGYNRRSYARKQWLMAVARKVKRREMIYARQLNRCRNELEKQETGGFLFF
jgi:hypothetical protein